MNAQPHDRAMHLDHVPVLDDPHALIRRRPRFSFYLLQRQRSAARNAWSALDQIERGTRGSLPTPAVDAPLLARAPFSSLIKHIPTRYIGHGVVLALVLAVIGTGGLPALALEMDWSQGAVIATDHVSNELVHEEPVSAAAPVVVAPEVNVLGAQSTNAVQPDALVPALMPRQAVTGSIFVGSHTVAAGETLGQIAAQYNVSAASVLAANAIDPKLLPIGKELRIPRASGVPHTVATGDTVESIAARYNVPSSAVRFFPANNLGNGRSLRAGEEIFVPGAAGDALVSEAEAAGVAATPVAAVRDNETRLRSGPGTAYDVVAKLGAQTQLVLLGRHESWYKIRTPNGTEGWISADLLGIADGLPDQVVVIDAVPALPSAAPVAVAPAPVAPAAPAPKPQVSTRWVWPAVGDLSSGFGYRNFRVGTFHNGIDIANRKGTVIRAARAGTVIAAGWCSGYGYCVKINHGNGLVTEYGHMASQPWVRNGQHVDAGQQIGPMGSTYDRKGGGYSTGVHLHFTVKLNGQAVNPMRYLP